MTKVTTRKEMTQGDVKSILIKLSWPIILGMIIQSSFNLVDTYFVGKLGHDALAAMSVAFPVIFITMALASGIGVGVNSLVSRKLGAKDKKGASNVSKHAYILMLIIYILIFIFAFTFLEKLYIRIGATENILNLVMQYSKTYFAGSFFLFFTFITNNILRAEGNTKTPMKIMIVAGLINAILDPIFIFGFGFIPAMGVRGASLATVISRILASIYLFYTLFLKENKFDFKYFKLDLSIIKEIFKIGIPATLNQVFISITLATMNIILAKSGEVTLAAFGLMMRLESFIFMPLSGLVVGVTTMVGQNFGAKKYKRIDKVVSESTKFGMIFIFMIAITILLFGENILGIFSDNYEVVLMGNAFFKMILFGYFTLPFTFVSGGAMQGMGNGIYSLVLQFLRTIFLVIPLSILFILVLKLEINYIMLPFLIANFIGLFISLIWYYKGSWRKKVLIN
ncbi:MAG: MATE family efflux transporter [Candidatus Nanoarchaeia archaeon]|nr:MATE family efflux transporter [Candidatus Nanoarchaeia archaeon]